MVVGVRVIHRPVRCDAGGGLPAGADGGVGWAGSADSARGLPPLLLPGWAAAGVPTGPDGLDATDGWAPSCGAAAAGRLSLGSSVVSSAAVVCDVNSEGIETLLVSPVVVSLYLSPYPPHSDPKERKKERNGMYLWRTW